MTDACFIALEIGGTKLQAVLGNHEGKILDRRRTQVDREAGAQGILAWASQQTQELMDRFPVKALGIGFGGPVESQSGKVLTSHQIGGWENVPIRQWFEERFAVPVVVANDANAAGWAEYRLGAGRGTQNFCYMNIGSGIGGALILEGRLYDGQGRGACEIGHTWVPDWTSNISGSAEKLERLCSGWAIENRMRSCIKLRPGSPLYALCEGQSGKITCALLAEAARQQDPTALAEIAAVANAVGIALGNVATLFHPERIALGGGVALMGEVLLNPISEALKARAFAPFKDTLALVPCALEEDVVVAGALLLAAEQRC